MELLTTQIPCETCGSSLDFGGPTGFCPACLLNTVLEPTNATVTGSQFDDYELLNEVARGGMGIVYRARQRTPSRIVALKMILPTQLNSPGAVDRFSAEAQAAAILDHEGILPIYAVGQHDGAPFYSMKFAEGGPLSVRLDRYRDKPNEAAALIARLARAMAHAHEHGILHRDLKPGNVLFDVADKPYISDFGLAKWLQRECDLTQTLAVLGTPYYMAPEQAKDSRAVTAAADVYSLGAILYHLLTGRPPVDGETPMEVLHRAAGESPTRPSRINDRIPRDLETICLKCLEKDPATRYHSAAALADDLERFGADRPILARPIGLMNHCWRWIRRNPGSASMAACLITLLVAVISSRSPRSTGAPAMKAVAVLPFDHPGAAETGELFATGLHDDVLVSLSKIADLKVISRNSVRQFQPANADPREIGLSLGVNAVLVGSLRQDGNRARITVSLIDVADGSQIWADDFDREMTDVFAIQSGLALQIASALKATVLPVEANGIRQQPTHNSRAYILYVEAKDLFADIERPRSKLERAEKILRQAVEDDPKFALAFALLSQTEEILADMYDPTPARLQQAKDWAEQALQLEPDLPEGHIALGRYFLEGQGHIDENDLDSALREFEIAQRKLPGNAEIYTLLGRVRRQQGKWVDALADLEKAATLDPNTASSWDRLSGLNIYLRRYSSALQAIERESALAPNSWRCEWLHAWTLRLWKSDQSGLESLRPLPESQRELYANLWILTLCATGRYDEAEAAVRNDPREIIPGLGGAAAPKSLFLGQLSRYRNDQAKADDYFEEARPILEQAVSRSPKDAQRHMALADCYAQLQRKEEAIREAKRACELLPLSKDAIDGAGLLTGLALVYLDTGETEQALAALEHALSTPAGAHVGQLRVSPDWVSLRNDPRFQRLLDKYASRD